MWNLWSTIFFQFCRDLRHSKRCYSCYSTRSSTALRQSLKMDTELPAWTSHRVSTRLREIFSWSTRRSHRRSNQYRSTVIKFCWGCRWRSGAKPYSDSNSTKEMKKKHTLYLPFYCTTPRHTYKRSLPTRGPPNPRTLGRSLDLTGIGQFRIDL